MSTARDGKGRFCGPDGTKTAEISSTGRRGSKEIREATRAGVGVGT